MLSIRNLRITVDNKEVVKGVSLTIRPGEIHALMGPNGSGKSTFAMAIAGHPTYQIKNQKSKIKNGSIIMDGTNITEKSPDQRARMGLFLAMQYPVGVEGITSEQLLRRAVQEVKSQKSKVKNSIKNAKVDVLEFRKRLEKLAASVGVSRELLRRSVNVGFSGGEKKRLEILQLLVLQPKYAILDETDSGLDVDALRTVAEMVKKAKWSNGYRPGILVITHYARLLKYLRPNMVHIMKDGKIVQSGNRQLAQTIEEKGYGV